MFLREGEKARVPFSRPEHRGGLRNFTCPSRAEFAERVAGRVEKVRLRECCDRIRNRGILARRAHLRGHPQERGLTRGGRMLLKAEQPLSQPPVFGDAVQQGHELFGD